VSVVKHFIEDSIKKKEIDEFLQNEFERAGYGGVSITKTPLGTHLVIYTMRPGLVIGRGGETIRALANVLEDKFLLPSPQISVAEIEVPELNAYVVASKIASALKRGIHYRRAGFWGLRQAMEAGALGIEIVISGKLRTDRARYEKFREGYLPKSGEPPRQYLRKAELDVHLKPGTLGVKVSLIPPDAQFPDQVKVHVFEDEIEREKELAKATPVAPETAEPEAEVEESEATEEPPETPEPVAEVKEETKAEAEPVKEEAKPRPAVEEKPVTPVEEKAKVENPKAPAEIEAAKEKAKKDVKPAEEKEEKPKAEEKPAEKKPKAEQKEKAEKPVGEKKAKKKVARKEAPKKDRAEPAPTKKEPAKEKKVANTKAKETEEKKEAGE
jgi:small subunit ribosomal protein S3